MTASFGNLNASTRCGVYGLLLNFAKKPATLLPLFGSRNERHGFEVVGTKDFTLETLLDYAEIPGHYFDAARWHTRYVSA
jgi:hypothetical protein